MDWKIWYADGGTYSDADGPWEKAPLRGVICVVVRDKTGTWGRFVNSGFAPRQPKCDHCGRAIYNEFYVCPPGGEPRATHELEAFRHQMQRAGHEELLTTQCIKYGEQASQEVWERVMLAAGNDPDFPGGTSPRRRYTDFRS